MICLSCANLDLQKHPGHARLGLGKCNHEDLTGTFVSFNRRRECAQFKPADAEIEKKRISWWNNSTKGK